MRKTFNLLRNVLCVAVAAGGSVTLAHTYSSQSKVLSRERSIMQNVASKPANESATGLNYKAFNQDLRENRLKLRHKVASNGLPQIFGSVTSSATLTTGMYEIPNSEGGEFVKQPVEISSNTVDASDGGVRVGNYYYSITSEEFFPGFSMVTLTSWEISESGWVKRWDKDGEMNLIATDFATDPQSNTVYGSLSDENGGWELCKVTFPKYKTQDVGRTVAGTLPQAVYAAAFDNDGVLYALMSDGNFATIETSTAETTTIGSSGLSLSGKGSGTIDPTTGRFFCTVTLSDGSSGLYEIAKSTGAATLVRTFEGNESVRGLYCNASEAKESVPGKATNLSAEFPRGELNGTVNFTAPTTDAEGNAGSGALKYTISLEGTTLSTGETEYGGTVAAAVTLPAEGEYELSIVLSNTSGAGEAAVLTVRAGKGLPKTPNLTAVWINGLMELSWDAVTESADGGYLDPAEVRYKIVRFPDEEVVGEEIQGTSITDAFVAPNMFTVYYYTIEASYAGKTSAPGRSANVGVGAYNVPYTQDFGAEFYRKDLLNTFTIIDANEDGQGWAYNSFTEVMRCRTMSTTEGADDWLILPAIYMEGGMVYELGARLKDGGETLQEQFEVKMGLQNTPEEMSIPVIEKQYVQSAELKEYKAYMRPQSSGNYYIGFHCTTPEDAYYLYLDDLSVVAKADAGIPQAPSEFNVYPDAEGLHTATISLKAPLEDVSGQRLGELSKITVSRDGKEIYVESNPTPGGTYTFEDNEAEPGEHVWTAVAVNRCGTGDVATTTAFIGIRPPMHPTAATAEETDNAGEVRVSWEAVNTDETGKPLRAKDITYSIARLLSDGSGQIVVAENLTGTEYTFEAVPEGEQHFINFAVFAKTEGGYSKGCITPQIIAGTPITPPYRESFANGAISSPFNMAVVEGGAFWTTMDDSRFADMKSHDGDNGYAAMAGTAEGDKASLTSGKISLQGVKNPVLSFYVYNMAGDWGRDDNQIEVQIGVNGKFQSVYHKANYESGATDQWNRVSIPLNQYSGKVIQVRITGTCVHAAYTVIDEIEIRSYLEKDMRAVSLTTPSRIVAGEPAVFVAEVENAGMQPVEGAAAVLYANDNAYMRIELPPLAFGEGKRVAFNCAINSSFGKEVRLKAKVDYYSDSNPDNDITATHTLAVEQTLLPSPSNLQGKVIEGGNIEMSWNAPDMSQAVASRRLETFEEATPWTTEVEGWSFLDLDKGGINGFDGVTFPGIPDGSRQSFWVMDDRLECLNNTFAAHSGHQYLTNMNVTDVSATDDWAITPRLCGKEHTVSFYARSYNWMFPEGFEVLYSKGGTMPEDFMSMEIIENVPWEWTEYSFTVPEGTRFFAVRSYYSNGVMLHIDDMSFVPEDTPESLTLLGYRIYADGIAENKEPLKECRFVAGGYQPHMHTYAVTAVYDKGESGPANILNMSGLSNALEDSVSIRGGEGVISISGADGKQVSVTTPSGLRVYDELTGNGNVYIRIEPGIYIVKAGNNTCKVTVR